MNQFLTYLITWWKSFDRGDLSTYPDPDPPAGLGTDLTQEEKDFVKKLKKEMDDRFTPPPVET